MASKQSASASPTFKSPRYGIESNDEDTNHSRPVEALEKGPGRYFAPPLTLSRLSLHGSIKVTPTNSDASGDRAAGLAIGVDSDPTMPTKPLTTSNDPAESSLEPNLCTPVYRTTHLTPVSTGISPKNSREISMYNVHYNVQCTSSFLEILVQSADETGVVGVGA